MQIVQHVAFAIERGFGRVQILGLFAGSQRAAAEADHFAGFVVNRKHQPAAKTIVEAGALLPLGHQSGLFQLLGRRNAIQTAGPTGCRRLRQAQAELGDLLGSDIAAGQILARLRSRRTSQIALEHATPRSRASPPARRGASRRGPSTRASAWSMPLRSATSLSASKKLMRSISMTNLRTSPPHVAAEAFVKLMAGMYRERRRLFGVERAQPGVARRAAHVLQAHVFADDFDDVDGGFDLLGEIHVR